MLTAHEMTYNSTMLNVTMDLNMTDTVIASVEKMAPVRPIHVATTVMFLSGIFHVSNVYCNVMSFRLFLDWLEQNFCHVISQNKLCQDSSLADLFMFSFLRSVKLWE